MAISINLKRINSDMFINQLKKSILDGSVDTWKLDDDGDFTHSSPQWYQKAWFRAYNKDDFNIEFGILSRRGIKVSMMEYSIYHGRFVELLLNHCSENIEKMEIVLPYKSVYDTKNVDYKFE